MRDIREDLEARRRALIAAHGDQMHAFDVDFDRLQSERRWAVETFNKEKALIDAMVALEERRLSDASSPTKSTDPTAGVSLRDFIVSLVESRGPIDKDELRECAVMAGLCENGRAFNMTLQNVISSGGIRRLEDGRFVDKRPLASLLESVKEEAIMTPQ